MNAGDPPKVLATRGPYTLSAACSDGSGGAKTLSIRVASTDSTAVAEGGPPIPLSATPAEIDSVSQTASTLSSNFRFVMTPGGSVVDFEYGFGVNVLGADCVASGLSFGQ
jgi:hypothetical protein